MSKLPRLDALAITVARAGALPPGTDDAVAEAGGCALVVGDGAAAAAGELEAATAAWHADTGVGMRPGALAAALAPVLAQVPLLILPGSADGRDLAPRLAHALGRSLLADATAIRHVAGDTEADLSRLHNKLTVHARVDGPAVATLLPGVAGHLTTTGKRPAEPLDPPLVLGASPDAEVLEVLAPDPATMDLAEARRVLGAGAGLFPAGAQAATGQAIFQLLSRVASVLGASAGATRVITDAGWAGYERQIGTTGVAIDPELYIAFGISGAVQHTGGLGAPAHVVSINTDASCPMTAMADLGVVADARGVLAELASKLGVEPIDA